MSIIKDIDKAAELAVNALPSDFVTVDEIGLYKVIFVLASILLMGAVYSFYRFILAKVKDINDELNKITLNLHQKIDKTKTVIKGDFREVRESCDSKDRRLTAVETKVSDMRGSLELTVKDMIEHKAETDIRVGNLEKIVSERLIPKLDDISDKLNQIVGKLNA